MTTYEQSFPIQRLEAAPFAGATRGLARWVREVFGATFILAVWAGLWLWALQAVFAPRLPQSHAERTAVVERSVVNR
jgi:hypothetical protein